MIQSLPSSLTIQKKFRDQIDEQISRVFDSLYFFPLPQIIKENNNNNDKYNDKIKIMIKIMILMMIFVD